ncbi:lipocalin family protein [Chryseobacterium sp. TY3]
MKKLLFLAVLSIISCRDDNDGSSSEVVGKWYVKESGIISGKDGSKLQWDEFSMCERKTSIEFTNDGRIIQKVFTEKANGDCVEEPVENGSYTYDSNTKVLSGKIGSDNFTREVEKATKSELNFILFKYDKDNDGHLDKYMQNYVR